MLKLNLKMDPGHRFLYRSRSFGTGSFILFSSFQVGQNEKFAHSRMKTLLIPDRASDSESAKIPDRENINI